MEGNHQTYEIAYNVFEDQFGAREQIEGSGGHIHHNIWKNIKDSLLPRLHELLESGQFVGGPYVKEFESKFKNYIGSLNAISCNSGTDGLWLALKALDAQPGSIILTTPFSFIASSSEIKALECSPVFIDVDESYNICPKKINLWLKSNCNIINNKTIHKKTGQEISGIISVNIFGQCADYEHINYITKKFNLWLIEDACQSVGAHINNRKSGTFGDISCFSLYPTKNLGAYGDGGIITTDREDLAQKIARLKNHGRKTHYEYEFHGINSRLDSIQALVGSTKLENLDKLNSRRREIAQIYNKRLSKLQFIKTPQEINGYHVYHQYSIEVIDNNNNNNIINRAVLINHLNLHGIGTNIVYPKVLYSADYLKPDKILENICHRAEKLASRVLSLPIWPQLTNSEIEFVCKTIEEITIISSIPRKIGKERELSK